MRTVYDLQGNPHTVENVDAREYLATGRYFKSPEDVPHELTIEKPKRGRKPASEHADTDQSSSAELTESAQGAGDVSDS